MTAVPIAPAAGERAAARPTPVRMAAADTLAVGSGLLSFGLVLGITVTAVGRDPWAAVLGAATVYGGSAQLTTTTLLAHGTALLLAVASGLVVNLRLLLYSAAMGHRFAGHGRAFRWLAPHLMIDQTFLMAETRPELVGREFRRYWTALGLLVLAVWTTAVLAGTLLGPALPTLPHLPLVCTAMFLGLLVPRLTARPALAAAAAGAACAALVTPFAPALGIVAGATAGITVALAVEGADDEQ